ncbi:MAG: response regulator [Pirellulaceae bacterium]
MFSTASSDTCGRSSTSRWPSVREAALEELRQHGPFAVVVSDMQMPGMTGVQLLHRIGELSPDTVRMMLTGNADQQTAVEAVNEGHIFRFLNKPCEPEVLALRSSRASSSIVWSEPRKTSLQDARW